MNRTQHHKFTITQHNHGDVPTIKEVVSASFAEELESELNQATEELSQLRTFKLVVLKLLLKDY